MGEETDAESELVLLEGREAKPEVGEHLASEPELRDHLVRQGVLDVVKLEDLVMV